VPRIKLTLEYDGAGYVGWQVQGKGRSIQGEVEAALEVLLGTSTRVEAAGRTDAGVHALGQVACFDIERALPLRAYVAGLNGLLPRDIAVAGADEVPEGFDPRRHAQGKEYRYLISNRRRRSPLRRGTHWELFPPLAVDAMREAARHLVGRHDFSAFRASDCQARNPVRELRSVAVEGEAGDALSISVEGTAFLKHMVRNLVGTLVEVGRGRQRPEWAGEVLSSRDRSRAGPTAPAHGLTLVKVIY